ncbi:hypothetical protein IMCC21906_01487 [Spongiibacter sp. IMCC21906]|nr:hypothetical protein IMCC21906_01487 [Spongiibacter sp. IMCC21906]
MTTHTIPRVFCLIAILSLSACNRPPESTALTPAQEKSLKKANALGDQMQQQMLQRQQNMQDKGI